MMGRLAILLAAAIFAPTLAAQEPPGAETPLPPPRPDDLSPVAPAEDPPQPPPQPPPEPPEAAPPQPRPPGPAAADDGIAASDATDEELASASALRRPEFDRTAALACEEALRAIGGRFDLVEPIGQDDAHCGAPRGLRLSEVAGVRLEPAIEARCPVALALAEWTRDVVKPMARLYLDDEAVAMTTVGDYGCRWTRGGQGPSSFSQHAFANAVDIGAVSFAGRAPVTITPPPERTGRDHLFQAAIRGGACAYFTTVIGPMTNAAHDDHFHFDMAERRGGYRLCE
ncbi:MAG: extensin family protein [Microvirga sp.]|nr:extensin family protein [Microvirga sp.]